MEDKEFSMLFEVICCYHPTEYDPVGKDGLYVKEVRKLEGNLTQRATDFACMCRVPEPFTAAVRCKHCQGLLAQSR